MEGLIVYWFKSFLEFMGVTPGGLIIAVGIALFIIWDHRSTKKSLDKQDDKIDKLWNIAREVQIHQSASDKRTDIHADHLTVLDNHMDRSLQIATNASNLSSKSIEMIMSLLRKR